MPNTLAQPSPFPSRPDGSRAGRARQAARPVAELLSPSSTMRSESHTAAIRAGLTGIILAGFNGASFLKYQLNISSMLMSAGFALSMGSYVLLLRLED